MTLFADAYFFIALLNPRDSAHEKAVAIAGSCSGRMLTTEWILCEVGDAMATPQLRENFAKLVDELRADDQVEVVASESVGFSEGLQLFRRRLDKRWSMTDCISFALMEKRQISEALTADVHFEQAGFRALFRHR